MGAHLIEGEFQSDKYPTTPRGKVPLSVKDKTAQDLLWQYAQRRRSVDAEFSEDLETALRAHGYEPPLAATKQETVEEIRAKYLGCEFDEPFCDGPPIDIIDLIDRICAAKDREFEQERIFSNEAHQTVGELRSYGQQAHGRIARLETVLREARKPLADLLTASLIGDEDGCGPPTDPEGITGLCQSHQAASETLARIDAALAPSISASESLRDFSVITSAYPHNPASIGSALAPAEQQSFPQSVDDPDECVALSKRQEVEAAAEAVTERPSVVSEKDLVAMALAIVQSSAGDDLQPIVDRWMGGKLVIERLDRASDPSKGSQ